MVDFSVIIGWIKTFEAILVLRTGSFSCLTFLSFLVFKFSAPGGPALGWNDFTVFYRTNAQSRALEEALIRHNIPYKLIGAVRFYQRKEIKDIISYLRFIATNDLMDLERIANVKPRNW